MSDLDLELAQIDLAAAKSKLSHLKLLRERAERAAAAGWGSAASLEDCEQDVVQQEFVIQKLEVICDS